MYDDRNLPHQAVAADLKSFFGDQVFQTVIPRSVRLAEAPSFGKPIMLYDVRSKGAESYIQLAKEILANDKRTGQNAKRWVRASRRYCRVGQPTSNSRTGGSASEPTSLRIDLIEANPTQPRTRFDPEKIEELAQSIRVNGIIQPLIVRKLGDKYELIAASDACGRLARQISRLFQSWCRISRKTGFSKWR